MGSSHALVLNEIVEELLEVRVEVRDVPVLAHEREHLPVRVRAAPEVPGVSRDVEAAENLVADGLDTELPVSSSPAYARNATYPPRPDSQIML